MKAYLDSGQPVGSRFISEQTDLDLSPASIRNVMGDLEKMGLLSSPHTSAGRMPTDYGLRYFVDSLMVVDSNFRHRLESEVSSHLGEPGSTELILKRATDELSQLTQFAGLVSVSEPGFSRIRKVELMPVSSEQVLAVIVSENDEVQNRLFPREKHMTPEMLQEASRQLSELLNQCDFAEARRRLSLEMESDRLHISSLLRKLKQWADETPSSQRDLFVRGQSKLLEMPEFSVIDTVRALMTEFEDKRNLMRLIEHVEQSDSGVKVFIGSEHTLVHMEQVSVVMTRYEGPGKVVGTLGVIGPRRMHYERVLPVVDCTANWVSRMLKQIR